MENVKGKGRAKVAQTKVPQRGKREGGGVTEEIMAENFPELPEGTPAQIRRVKHTSNKTDEKKSTSSHTWRSGIAKRTLRQRSSKPLRGKATPATKKG